MTKVKTFCSDYSSDLEDKINKELKGKKIVHTSICTKEEEGIMRNSPNKTYLVALVTYEDNQ